MLTEDCIQNDEGLAAVEAADVLATKIGGDNACEFQTNLARTQKRHEQGKAQIIVVSALKRTGVFNTTDKLLEIVEAIRRGQFFGAGVILESIKNFHEEIIDQKVEEAARPILKAELEKQIDRFTYLLENIERSNDLGRVQNLGVDWIYTDETGAHHSLTGFGEDLCQSLYKVYFAHHGLETSWIKKEAMTQRVYPNGPSKAFTEKRETLSRVREVLEEELGETLKDRAAPIQLDSGHLPFVASRRGYTDAATAEEARAADSHGPRTIIDEQKKTTIMTGNGIKGAKRVGMMSRAIGAELTGVRGAAAKVLQADVMGILKGTRVDVVIGDPDAPEKGTTYIPWDAGLEVDEMEIVQGKAAKTVLRIEGNMANRKGVLAEITDLLRSDNIDQTVSTRDTVTITLDSILKDGEVEEIEAGLQRRLDNSFTVQKQDELGMVFCLGGSQREHPDTGVNGKILMANRVAEPPFAATVLENSEEGVHIPYALTIEGPMSDSSGVLAVITNVLRNYNIDQTFSTEATWTVTLDEEVQDQDLRRLYDALNNAFGNGWTFSPRTDLKIVAQTENFSEHPLWNLLQANGIEVHYMHALPDRGVTMMMVPQNQLSRAEIILHNHFHEVY